MTYFAFTKSLGGPGGYDYHVPLSGQTYTIPDGVTSEILNPATPLAALTLMMPTNPTDGQTVQVSTTQNLTSLTVEGAVVSGTSGFLFTLFEQSESPFGASDRGPTASGSRFVCAGANDYGNAAISGGSPQDVTAAFSIALWYRHTNGFFLASRGMFAKVKPALLNGQTGFELILRGDGNNPGSYLHLGIAYGGNFVTFEGANNVVGGGQPGDNVWHHVVVTCDGVTPTGTVNVYYDNTLYVTGAAGPGDTSGPNYGGAGFDIIGATSWNGSPGQPFVGGNPATCGLDEVRVYNRVLTSGERTALFNNGLGPTDWVVYAPFDDMTNPTEGDVPVSTVKNPPPSPLLAGEGFKYIYRALNTTWYRQE